MTALATVGKGKNPLTLDAAKLVDSRLLIQGCSGSGKSYLFRLILEQLIPQGVQCIVFDRDGDFFTLREKCDLLLCGPGGDVPVELRSCKLLMKRIGETGVSAVVDMGDHPKAVQQEIVQVMLDTLASLPRKNERPRLVGVDEIHLFCPEGGKGASKCTEAIVNLASLGRKRGIGLCALTQRLSKLRKDAAAELATVFIGQTSPIDLASAQDMLGLTPKERELIRTLEPGEFYAAGPALVGVKGVVRFSAKRSETTHPEPGSRGNLKAPPPPRKAIEKILADFKDIPPPQAVEDDAALSAAKARIRELEKQLSKAEKTTQSSSENERLRWYAASKLAARDKLLAKYIAEVAKTIQQLQIVAARLQDATTAAASTTSEPLETLPERPRLREQPKGHAQRMPAKRSSTKAGGVTRILQALAQHGPQDRDTLALLSRLSKKSGTYGTYLSAGKTQGLWDFNGHVFELTAKGVAEAGDIEPLPEGEELLEYWCAHPKVPGKAGDMLRMLYAEGSMSRTDLAERVGLSPTSGTYGTYLSAIRSLKLIQGSATIALSEVFS